MSPIYLVGKEVQYFSRSAEAGVGFQSEFSIQEKYPHYFYSYIRDREGYIIAYGLWNEGKVRYSE